VKGLRFDVTCPECGGPVELLAKSEREGGTFQSAVVKCLSGPGKRCGWRFAVTVQMAHVAITADGEPSRCGTPSGARQHRVDGTEPCEECRIAWNQAERARADSRNAGKRRRRAEVNA